MVVDNKQVEEIKSEIKEETAVIEEQQIQEQIVPPIPVTIVNNNGEQQELKQKEFFENYDLLIRKMKEALDLFPKPPGKLMKAWLWFQKHAFTSVLFIVLGIGIGIGIEKIMNYNDLIRAVNLQRMEFKGDLFEIQPSSIRKFYTDGQKSFTTMIQTKKESEDSIKESVPETTVKPITKTITK